MDFNSILAGVLSNAIWWILGISALVLVWFFRRTRAFWRAIPFAIRLRREGVRRFLFSRHEYPERLDAYLERASHSIKIVSISFRLTNNECALTELFRKKLAAIPSFEIWISLLQPNSHAAVLAAHALNIKPDALSKEIDEMLNDLKLLRDSLPPSVGYRRGRFGSAPVARPHPSRCPGAGRGTRKGARLGGGKGAR